MPPLSRFRVYTCKYASKHADFFLLFLTFSMKEVTKKVTKGAAPDRVNEYDIFKHRIPKYLGR